LFAPGSDRRKLGKVGSFGADAIVLDLEDAVAEREKVAARALVREAIPTYEDTVVVARVNGAGTGLMEDDIASTVCPGLACVMVPKVESSETLDRVDEIVAEQEDLHCMEPGEVRVLALIETAKGLVGSEDIAARAPSRLLTLVFGLGDFSTDIGVDLTEDSTELLYARSRVVVAARAAGLRPPIDGPFLDLKNEEALAADCRRSRQLGFQGRVTVYPPQVETTQRCYSWLSEEEARQAREVVEAFDAAEREGSASIRVEGRFVDYPIYYRAREKLKLYDAYRQTGGVS
jgi:citrate lyase subunit beta/citryl-CoA lyase